MGAMDRVRVAGTASASAVADSGATEKVILTSAPVSTPGPGATISIIGHINETPGTSGTAVVVRVRRGTLTGTVVGTAETDTLAAGNSESIAFNFTDSGIDVDGLVYVVTVSVTGAGANAGTVNFASITAIIS
jgi:hypothetical protein